MTMLHLPDSHSPQGTQWQLCGTAFDKEGNLWGQYFARNYCGRTAAAAEYNYGMAVEKAEDFKLKTSGYPPQDIKRFTKRPCEFCGEKSIDRCTTC